MKTFRLLVFAIVFSTLVILGSPSTARGSTLIDSGGSTFVFPIMTKWTAEFLKVDPDAPINYESIGSGAGIHRFLSHTLDFAASDAPLTDKELANAGAPVLHVPAVLGAVVLTYNLPSSSTKLKLSPDVLADIFLGKLTKWNDPRLQKLNPELKITGDISVVHRLDGSGTTYLFTDYLSKISPEWKTKVGSGVGVSWPTGAGERGNEGVSNRIKLTPGSIGYVELSYVETKKLPAALLQNKAGEFVVPNHTSITSAADAGINSIPSDLRVSITDANGKGSYPISGFSYFLVWKKPSDPSKSAKITRFMRWVLKEGQRYAEPMSYAQLPMSVVARAETVVDSIEKKPIN